MDTGQKILIITFLFMVTNSLSETVLGETLEPTTQINVERSISRQPALKLQNSTLTTTPSSIKINLASIIKKVQPVLDETETTTTKTSIIPLIKLVKAAKIADEKADEPSDEKVTLEPTIPVKKPTIPTTPTPTSNQTTEEPPTTELTSTTTESPTVTTPQSTTEQPPQSTTEQPPQSTTKQPPHSTQTETSPSHSTATPEPSPTPTSAPSHHHLTKGEIAAVVIFTLILVSITCAGIVYILRRRRQRQDTDYSRLVT